MNFNDPRLIDLHGDSWIDVQVAFYDFIWKSALTISASEFNEKVLEGARQQIEREGFSDDSPFFSQQLAVIKKTYRIADEAWNAFVKLHDEINSATH
jgi:hypothetical protein